VQQGAPQQRFPTGAYPAVEGQPAQNQVPQIVVGHPGHAALQGASPSVQRVRERSSRDNAITRETNYKKCTVRTIDGTTIHGMVNISGTRRLSDLFASDSNTFIVMVDVRMGGGRDKTIFVNKNHIVWVEPLDNETDRESKPAS